MNSFKYLSDLFSSTHPAKPPVNSTTSAQIPSPDFPIASTSTLPSQDDPDDLQLGDSSTIYLSARSGSRPGERPRISISSTEPPRIAALRRDGGLPPAYEAELSGYTSPTQVPLPDSPELVGRDEKWLEGVVELRDEEESEVQAGERRLRMKEKERQRLIDAGKSWPVRYSVGLYLFFRQLLAFVGWRIPRPLSTPPELLPALILHSAETPTTMMDDKDELLQKLSLPPAPPPVSRSSTSFFSRTHSALSSSIPTTPIPSTPPLSAPRPPRLTPKTLVLDLDETLIHSTSRPYPIHGTRGNGLKVRVVEVVLDGRSTVYTVYKRPWVDFFLRKVSTWYTVIIFTASLPEYADPVIDWLDGGDGGGGMVGGRLFRSDCLHTNGAYVKDLSVVDADLSRVCLVDNSPASYAINQANGIPIEGWINDPNDECLLDLLPMLDSLRFTADSRRWSISVLYMRFFILASLALAGVTLTAPTPISVSPFGCAGGVLSTIAHADDHLLFQSPNILTDLTNGRCFTTIVLTAGESDFGLDYALEREAGTEAAVAGIVGVKNEWSIKVVTLGGQPVVVKSLVGNSNISTVWMRLPDGGFPSADGHFATNFTSIPKLAAGTISSITSIDGQSTFTLSTLNSALREALLFANPAVVRTLDFSGSAASTLDHPDHLSSAILMRDIVLASLPSAQLVGYQGYGIANKPPNLTPSEIVEKSKAFFAYAAYDSRECTSTADCEFKGRAEADWLQRQYEVQLPLSPSPLPIVVRPGNATYSSNIARKAIASASSEAPDQGASRAIDGFRDGYPLNPSHEWSTTNGGVGSWLMLSWTTPQIVSRVALYDRTNLDDGIKAGILSFSDGSFVFFGAISNDGSPKVINIRTRKVTWVKILVTKVSESTKNVGLSEVEVFSKY